mmetsp:Transcript_51437/g.147475  ORF Transcript_51437/g.147475 Transcript_51437/m.147475 type:complete len:294 (+) Transcript_51437:615-1496(+)
MLCHVAAAVSEPLDLQGLPVDAGGGFRAAGGQEARSVLLLIRCPVVACCVVDLCAHVPVDGMDPKRGFRGPGRAGLAPSHAAAPHALRLLGYANCAHVAARPHLPATVHGRVAQVAPAGQRWRYLGVPLAMAIAADLLRLLCQGSDQPAVQLLDLHARCAVVECKGCHRAVPELHGALRQPQPGLLHWQHHGVCRLHHVAVRQPYAVLGDVGCIQEPHRATARVLRLARGAPLAVRRHLGVHAAERRNRAEAGAGGHDELARRWRGIQVCDELLHRDLVCYDHPVCRPGRKFV